MSMTPKIKVQNLRKSFGNKQVLKGISFDLEKGKSLVILGGSGSGKSVLIKSIIGLMIPDEGSMVRLEGRDITFLPLSRRANIIKKTGVLFQGGALFDSLSVWRNVAFGLMQRKKLSRNEAREIVAKKLSLVGLTPDVMDLRPIELSGGMQKRVALARAIAANPDIIFFDEPTAGLDPIMSGVISELIAKCSEELGATTITITHDMRCARKVADDAAMIYDGKFVWQGKGTDLEKSGNPYVEQFVKGSTKGPIPV
jgi:phospholipid/cholesterol/gamma-HCH transport system ATP-binding protein